MKPFRWMVLASVAMLALSCGDSSGPEPPPDPIPGWLKVRLNSPNPDDGGIIFTVSGGQIEAVRSSYTDLYFPSGASSSKRIIVAGNLTPGFIVELKVPDVQLFANYAGAVEQVATRDTYQQRQVSSYSLVVER